jgi:hypothetical protein
MFEDDEECSIITVNSKLKDIVGACYALDASITALNEEFLTYTKMPLTSRQVAGGFLFLLKFIQQEVSEAAIYSEELAKREYAKYYAEHPEDDAPETATS